MLAIRPAGKVIGWSAVQVILWKRIGLESLAYSFVLFALMGMFGSMLYVVFADAVRRDKLLKIYCSATGMLLLVSVLLLPDQSASAQLTPLTIACAVLVMLAHGLGDETISMQIWTIINDHFRPNQGFRLYPIIATAPMIGGILGGVALQFLSDHWQTETLILFWGIGVLSVLPIISLFQKLYGSNIQAHNKEAPPAFWETLCAAGRFSLRSALIQAISLICILFWTVASLKECQYSQIVNSTFASEAKLNEYFGYYTIFINVAVIALQFRFTGQVLKMVGIGYGLHMLPVTILLGIVITGVIPCFWAAFIMRFTWDIVAMTVQGSSYQLLFHAMPGPYRGRIRGLLEGIMNPLGGIVGGTLIILLQASPNSASAAIPMLGLLFALAWLGMAIIARKVYHRTIVENLASKDRRTYLDALEMFDEIKKQLEKKQIQDLLKQQDCLHSTPLANDAGNESDQEFFVAQDIRNNKKTFKKSIFDGHGKITFYCKRRHGCYRVRVVMKKVVWNVEHQEQQILLKKGAQNVRQFAVETPGSIYWENETGYLAVAWRQGMIKWVEMGNYLDKTVIGIRCRSKGLIFPRKLTHNGKYVNPFPRFMIEIEPLGYCAV